MNSSRVIASNTHECPMRLSISGAKSRFRASMSSRWVGTAVAALDRKPI